MKVLYVAKSFGRYYFFNDVNKRQEYIDSLPVWESKYVETYEVSCRERS